MIVVVFDRMTPEQVRLKTLQDWLKWAFRRR